jgi:hypothetical protein
VTYAYRTALLLVDECITIVILDGKAKTSRVNVPVSPDEEGTEDGLRQKVQHTVENSLRVGGDEVASLADAPCNGVQDPCAQMLALFQQWRVVRLTEECSHRSANGECSLDVASVGASVKARLPDKLVDNVYEREAAEDEVSPLVIGNDERANKTSHNHDLVNNDGPKDSRPWHSGGEQEIEKEERGGNEPINVSSIVDGPVGSSHNGVAALVLDANGSEAKVGAHSKVCNGSDEDYSSSDVVEDAIATVLAHAESDEAEAGDCGEASAQISCHV